MSGARRPPPGRSSPPLLLGNVLHGFEGLDALAAVRRLAAQEAAPWRGAERLQVFRRQGIVLAYLYGKNDECQQRRLRPERAYK